MYLLVIAWAYVVLMMCVAEATSPNGSLLGAFFTFLLYGALPLSIAIYLMGTPMRRRKQRQQAQAESALEKTATERPQEAPSSESNHDERPPGEMDQR